MQERHQNKKQYFEEQIRSTRASILPYVEAHQALNQNTKVLEIGCGHGGNLIPFLEKGCTITGVDLSPTWIEHAHQFYQEKGLDPTRIILKNIYDFSPRETFDFIFLKDVIEHIHNQEHFMHIVKRLLAPGGTIFFAFPPWQMPFGGHQQVCKSKLAKAPWIHLLPTPIYKTLLKIAGEAPSTIEALLEIKQTGISIERFERILKQENYRILQKTHWLINPNYEVKFGLKPRKQIALIAAIPYLRNYFTTCAYYHITASTQ